MHINVFLYFNVYFVNMAKYRMLILISVFAMLYILLYIFFINVLYISHVYNIVSAVKKYLWYFVYW